METVKQERYWSFSFWLRKSLWLGMIAMAAWMLWQFIVLEADVTDTWWLFTNGFFRVVGAVAFAYLLYFFAQRFAFNWAKDAAIAQPFTPVLDEQMTPNRMVDEPFIQASEDFDTPPPFAAQKIDDNLTLIEGVGPSIAEVLQNAGVGTYAVLASQTTQQLENILSQAGSNFRFHDPSDWPMQAEMLLNGQTDRLNDYQKRRN